MTLAVSTLDRRHRHRPIGVSRFPDLASAITSARVQQHAGVFDQQQQV